MAWHPSGMSRTWLSVTVELLGGRGQEPWPRPGRIFAVGPSHTFMDLADAINTAFARWDRSHLSMFVLADGRVVTDGETGDDLAGSPDGPLLAGALDIATVKVDRTLAPGDEFQFTFDFGDGWTHRCVIGPEKIDPLEVLGIRPRKPLPYWGWGSIPDQYGRRWADDDGEGRAPQRPSQPDPMLLGVWPEQAEGLSLDLVEVRQAIAAGDADRFLAAVTGRDVDDVLQQLAAGIPMALEQQRKKAEPVTLSFINRLSARGNSGDQMLAEDLLARVRDEPLAARVVPLDLDLLSAHLEGDPSMSTGGYIDLSTGEVYDDSATDPMMVGDDIAIDVEDEPDRWLAFDRSGSRDGWHDMESFAERQRDEVLRERLVQVISGKGAFRRFRDIVHEEGLAEQWYAFSTDRQLGRAREFLADQGIRVG